MASKIVLVVCLLFFSFPTWSRGASVNQFGSSSARYIENKGQVVDQYFKYNAAVLYLYNGNNINIQLRNGGFSYDNWKNDPRSGHVNYHRIDINFVRPNPAMRVVPSGMSADYLNYYTSYASAIKNIHSYGQVVYKDVWKGIDISFELINEQPKYNIILHPGSDINDVRFDIVGANSIETTTNGLDIVTDLFTIQERVPYSYYENGKERKNVTAGFSQKDGWYGVAIKETMPSNVELVIDPVPTVMWCTMYGGGGKDSGRVLSVASNSDVYFAGQTQSSNAIATSGAFRGSYMAGDDMFISRFTSTGARKWATYYGGANGDYVSDIAVNAKSDFVCITGNTFSDTGIASVGAHQVNRDSDADIFLLKLDSAGGRVWCTYYGGDGEDMMAGVGIDKSDYVYLAGTTHSSNNIASSGTYKSTAPSGISSTSEGFLAKFTPSGARVWGTYFGGDDGEYMTIAGIYNDTAIIVSGYTASDTGIATTGTFQKDIFGNYDLFIAKFDSSGNFKAGTYYGGPNDEYTIGKAAVDAAGNIYVHGYTESDTAIASVNAHQTSLGSVTDGCLAKFSFNLQRVWGTYYGGDGLEETHCLAVDNSGAVYMTGITESTNQIATPGTWLSANQFGGRHMFLTKFSRDGKQLWGTYLLGAGASSAYVGFENDLYIAGWSSVAQIGTAGAHQQFHNGGGTDGFLMKIQGCHVNFVSASSNSPVKEMSAINLSAAPSGMMKYQWSHSGGFSSSLQNPVISNALLSDAGIYTLVVTDSAECMDTATVSVVVEPLGIKDMDGNVLFQVYPNPANDILNIACLNAINNVEVAIADMQGREIINSKLIYGENKIPISHLPSSTYIATIRHNDEAHAFKIWVQH